jgi:FkbM family methyltransferase
MTMSLSALFPPDELEDLRRRALRPSMAVVAEASLRERGLILFGLGYHGRLCLDLLKRAGLAPLWIVDNNPALAGTETEGVPIRGSESLSRAGSALVLLAGQRAPSMAADCQAHGAQWILPAAMADFLYTPGQLGATFDELDAMPEVEAAWALLRDERSRAVFKDFIRFQCAFEPDLFRLYEPDQYFPKGLKDRVDYSCFVDAGAFDGDTLRTWAQETGGAGHYHAFEPQAREYGLLADCAAKLSSLGKPAIKTYRCGLGDKDETLALALDGISGTFSALGAESGAGPERPEATEVRRLDSVGLPLPPTVVKCDVEGFEMALLKGALNTITDKTALMIAVYHKKFDFIQIPLFLQSINLNYKIYFRQHFESYGETVCYAIP